MTSLNAALEKLALAPLVFVAVLALFVVATAAFENDTAAFAASRLLDLPHG